MVCVSPGTAGVGVSELSNGDTFRADRDRRTAAICYVVWGAFATWVSVGRASAMWSLWMADANFDVQRDVQLFGWLELHCAGTVDGTKHIHITATAWVSCVRAPLVGRGHVDTGVSYDIHAPYEPRVVCRV